MDHHQSIEFKRLLDGIVTYTSQWSGLDTQVHFFKNILRISDSSVYAFRRLRPREHSQCLAIIASSPDENSKIITKLIYHSIKPDATETRTSKGTKAIERDFGSLKLPRAEPRGCSHLGFTIIPWKSTKSSNQQDDHELK